MKILILGAGRVGSSLASTLSRQEYEVSIVDLNKDKLLRLQEDYDLATEIGHASHPITLEKAGADEETIVLAVTNSDECNITSCQIAKSKFNVKKTICRLSDSAYLESLEAFGKDNIDIAIGPENEVTEHLVDLIKHPGAEQIESFANGSLKAVSVKARKDGMLVNRELKSIKSDMPDTDTFVPAIYRKGKPLIPDGKTIIKEPDDSLVMALLLKYFDDRQIHIKHSNLTYIATRINRTYSSIYEFVNLIDHKSLVLNTKVTRTLIDVALKEIRKNKDI